jgi:hypothetical protein
MTRNKQTVYPGLGNNYLTPEKPGRRAKNKVLVSRPIRKHLKICSHLFGCIGNCSTCSDFMCSDSTL